MECCWHVRLTELFPTNFELVFSSRLIVWNLFEMNLSRQRILSRQTQSSKLHRGEISPAAAENSRELNLLQQQRRAQSEGHTLPRRRLWPLEGGENSSSLTRVRAPDSAAAAAAADTLDNTVNPLLSGRTNRRRWRPAAATAAAARRRFLFIFSEERFSGKSEIFEIFSHKSFDCCLFRKVKRYL